LQAVGETACVVIHLPRCLVQGGQIARMKKTILTTCVNFFIVAHGLPWPFGLALKYIHFLGGQWWQLRKVLGGFVLALENCGSVLVSKSNKFNLALN
jgi:hypothetical protein